jgi:hypothetical protein
MRGHIAMPPPLGSAGRSSGTTWQWTSMQRQRQRLCTGVAADGEGDESAEDDERDEIAGYGEGAVIASCSRR